MENTDGQKTSNYENKIQPENIMDKKTPKKTKKQKLRLEYENPNKNKEGYAEGIIISAGSKTPDHLTGDSRSSRTICFIKNGSFLVVLVQTRQTLDLNVTDICKEERSKFHQDATHCQLNSTFSQHRMRNRS